MSIERRVDALERRSGGGEDLVTIRVVRVAADGTATLERTLYHDLIRGTVRSVLGPFDACGMLRDDDAGRQVASDRDSAEA